MSQFQGLFLSSRSLVMLPVTCNKITCYTSRLLQIRHQASHFLPGAPSETKHSPRIPSSLIPRYLCRSVLRHWVNCCDRGRKRIQRPDLSIYLARYLERITSFLHGQTANERTRWSCRSIQQAFQVSKVMTLGHVSRYPLPILNSQFEVLVSKRSSKNVRVH